MVKFRLREENLKKKYDGKNDMVPVNAPQFVYISEEKEEKFYEGMYPNKKDRENYEAYRDEWYRRAKEFDAGEIPLSVNIELVSTCNLACTMCYTITDKFQNSIVGAQRMMPWKIVKAIIDDAADNGVSCLSFSWRGESTMYRYRDNDNIYTFPDVLKYAVDKGILEVNSLTHGQLIDEKMAEEIVLAQPSWISFSIDGLEDEYNQIRTPANKIDTSYNAFQRVIKSINLINKFKKKHNSLKPQLRTNTIFPAIQKNPEEYKKFMENIGVDFITVNEIVDYRHHRLEQEKVRENWACQFPFQRLVVSANGIVLPCTGCYNEEIGLVIGKYKGSADKVVKDYSGKVVKSQLEAFSIKEAWNSEKIKKIRELHKNGRRKEIEPGCRNCHHGAAKHGADYVPKEWDTNSQQWLNHKHLSEKRKYSVRANNAGKEK
ncbi:SPASM domain-containing protein [Candidatus Pelagibacter sp.]|nr:SPASM domain-containing protein [Candidatus Pelagibacter sp.]